MTQVTTPIQNLLVIDSRVKDWQSLVAGVSANTAILILDPNSDGLTQISNYLTAKAGLPLLQGIQIFSHGSAGSLLLGSSTITNSTLNLYTKQLAKIGTSLTDTGDVLLYGCNVAANKTGVDFINQFAALTNADVAASNNLTGSAALGGDWQLEASTGSIEATAALTSTTLNSYTGSLVAITPSVKVSAGITPEESGATGSFTFTLDSAAPAGGLTINYSLAGTATLSTDYSVTAGTNVTAVTGSSFTIAAGQTTATLAINAVSDGIYDPNETVVFTLAAGTGYVVSYNLSLAPKVDFATGFNPYSVSVGDFNGDGKTDLAVANASSNTVSVLLRNAANTGFDSKVDFATGSFPISVSVGDFNGDGKTDLAVANASSSTVSVLLRNAANTGFDSKVDFATGSSPYSVSVGDFNGDGKTDFAVANYSSNTVSVLLRNAANNGFAPKVDFATGSNPSSVSVGDFNGDGKTDFAVANYNSATVSVLLRNAANTGFDSKVDFATGSIPYSVSVGDFNGDGKTDLAVANYSSNTVSVLLRNAANTGFDSKVDFATGSSPYSVSVGDFNGDGKTDLAVANAGSNTVSVLLRNAANTGFASKVDFATGSNPSSVSVGDFNGDGKTDLAVADTYSNTVSVLSNNSTATASLTITTNALPTLTTFAAPVASGNDNSQIPVTFANLIAQGNEADVDGSVIAFVIKAVSTGTLTIGSTAATAAVWNASTNNTIDATHQAFWTQAPDASGTLNAFTAVAKDNGGEESTTAIQATIYVNAVLNNLTLNGTQGNDTLIGDAIMSGSYDALNGLAGNDILNGLAGIDTLNGDLGNDILDGGLGGDTMTGGLGNDTYVVDSLTDVVIETSTLVTEIDTVRSGVTYTLGANLENLVLTGNSAINGIGNALNNTITGNAAANILEGGLGRDTLTGGAGNDLYNIDASDIVVELANGGSDTVQIASGYTLVNSYIENATLTGFAAANLVGNLLDNVLTGNSADNVLNGGRGADSMAGGAGNDTYVIDDSGDTVTEAVAEGKDTVISQISYILGANLEGLRLLGANAINGTGNVQDNLLVGNSADNTLIAGAGADQLIGGDGNDTYYIDTSDQVFENIFEGTADRVIISDNWTLGDNLENLDLTGTGNFNGTGNEADNIINGNSGNNILDGKSGADTMNGGYGNDIYLVDNIGDIASENFSGTGIDLVKSTVTHTLGYGIENLTLLGTLAIDGTGNNLDNVIKGNSGRNILDGSYGADSLFGGAGADDLYSSDGLDTLVGGLNNDTYYVCYDSDNIIEQSAQGTDTVVFGYIYTNSAYAYTLGANLENLILIGGDIDGHGNSLNNAITGSNGNNLLDGGTGIDVLRGLKGNDTYLIDNVNDQIIEILNEGIDEALSSVSYTLAQNVDNLSLIGASAINGTGNIIANRLIGNDAANTLSGLDGNDVLLGGGGNDILIGGNGNDSLNGGIGNDQLNGGAGIDSANYFNMAAGVKVDLTITAAQNTGNGGIDTLTGIESIDGSNSGADELSGDGLDNRIYGYGGNDTLRGGAGNDILSGGEGDDTLFGDAGNDGIDGGNGVDMVSYYSNAAGVNIDLNILTTQNTGGAGLDILTNIENIEGSNKGNDILTGDENNNILSGFGGNDVLEGGAGDDILNGGSGNDTADFSGATEEIVIELFTGATTNDGFGSIDTLISIENLIGGDFDDLLWGDSGANILDGGAGNDSLTGGAGNDIFDFNALTDLGLGDAARDVITDFVSGQDKIDFSTIDSNAALAGDQAFTLIGSIAAFSTAGQIRYSAGLISINTDTDVAAEFEIQLTGVIPATLAATDFVL